MHDELSPPSENRNDYDDDDESLDAPRIEKPIFENNFLQRWLKRNESDDETELEQSDTEKSPFSISKRFRNIFSELFPRLAEATILSSDEKQEITPDPFESTEINQYDTFAVAEEEYSIDHTPGIWNPDAKTAINELSEELKDQHELESDVAIKTTEDSGEIIFSHEQLDSEDAYNESAMSKRVEVPYDPIVIVSDDEQQEDSILSKQFDVMQSPNTNEYPRDESRTNSEQRSEHPRDPSTIIDRFEHWRKEKRTNRETSKLNDQISALEKASMYDQLPTEYELPSENTQSAISSQRNNKSSGPRQIKETVLPAVDSAAIFESHHPELELQSSELPPVMKSRNPQEPVAPDKNSSFAEPESSISHEQISPDLEPHEYSKKTEHVPGEITQKKLYEIINDKPKARPEYFVDNELPPVVPLSQRSGPVPISQVINDKKVQQKPLTAPVKPSLMTPRAYHDSMRAGVVFAIIFAGLGLLGYILF